MTTNKYKDHHNQSLIRRTLRLTPANAKLVKDKAALMGVSVNQFINFIIANSNLKITQKYKYSDQEAEKIRRELIYLHRNFNQYNIELNRVLAMQTVGFSVSKAIEQIDALTKAINQLSDQIEPRKHIGQEK